LLSKAKYLPKLVLNSVAVICNIKTSISPLPLATQIVMKNGVPPLCYYYTEEKIHCKAR